MLPRSAYFRGVRRFYPPLIASFQYTGGSQEEQYKAFVDKPVCVKNMVNVDGWLYYVREEIDQLVNAAFSCWCDKEKFEKVKKHILEKEKDLLLTTKKSFEEYAQAYEAYMPVLFLVWRIEEKVEPVVRNLLLQKLSPRETQDLMLALNIPEQDNFFKQEEYDLVHAKNLQEHVKKYAWLNARYGSRDPYTIKEAKNRLVGMDKTSFLKKWKEEKAILKEKIAYAKSIIGKKNEHLIDLMQFILYCRTQRTDIMNKSQYLAIPLLDALAKEKKLTYQQLLHCTKEEVLGTLPSKDILSKRIKRYVFLLDNKKIKVLIGDEAEKIDAYLKEDVQDIKELKGNIACKGKVQGKVRIVVNAKDHIERGDILITSMTSPNMLSLIQKASAIITDEGGITCHAAIISRELKKPCIIGTKHATEVFKTGDLVEVDANQGIVRKLS